MVNIDLFFIAVTIVLGLIAIATSFISMKTTTQASKRNIIGSIYNIRSKEISGFWKLIMLIPFTAIIARTIELMKNYFGYDSLDGVYRVFDLLIVIIVLWASIGHTKLLEQYLKKK